MKVITCYKCYCEGWMIGFRTWTLEGYDNDKLISKVSENCKNNHIKLNKFLKDLKSKNFKCNENQLQEIKEKLLIDFDVNQVSRDQLKKMIEYIGVESDINKVAKYNEEEMENYADSIGITIEELKIIINKYKDQ